MPGNERPETSADELLTLRGVADAIGVDPGQLSKESQRPGFPCEIVNGVKGYLASDVLAWRHSNVRRKKISPAAGQSASPVLKEEKSPSPRPSPRQYRGEGGGMPAAQSAPPAMPTPARKPAKSDPNDERLLELMKSGTASALEKSRALVHLLSSRVSESLQFNTLSPNELDGFKKSLQELRTAEKDYSEQAIANKELIPIDDVRFVVGQCCSRLVQCLGHVENAIAMEFSIWLADPALREMNAEERGRKVRQFVAGLCAKVRQQEADDVNALIAASAGDGEQDDDPST